MKIHLSAAFVAVALLSGCQTPTGKGDARTARGELPDAQTASQASRVPLQLQQLWMEGELRDATPLPVTAIHADSDRITLSWNGDALELLTALARARGQVFSYAGVRLPLPVDIEVQGVTWANLLRIIEMQTAWRATLVTYPGQMVLEFMSAIPAKPVRHAKGGRR